MRTGWGSSAEDPGEPESWKQSASDSAQWRDFMAEMTTQGATAAELPPRLCSACVRLLPVAGASISIVGSEGSPVTLCASDGVAARLAEIQYTLGEGPCRYATQVKAPVLAGDLTDGPDSRRWPLFAREAVAAGASAVFSFPLSQGGSVLGTMDLYDPVPRRLADRYIPVALRAAEAVTLALGTLHHEQSTGSEAGVAWFLQAEANHEEVYRAAGMLMVRLGVGADEAMARLRARAFSLDRTVTEVAKDIVNRTDDFGASD